MLVVRYTWHIEAQFDEVVKLFLQIIPPEHSPLRGFRGYQSVTGLMGTLALEWEFDSFSDWEEFQRLFYTSPQNVDKLSKWGELVTGEAVCEVWSLLGSG